jgi:small neutral amino acid transporter SnatA (MarC family)
MDVQLCCYCLLWGISLLAGVLFLGMGVGRITHLSSPAKIWAYDPDLDKHRLQIYPLNRPNVARDMAISVFALLAGGIWIALMILIAWAFMRILTD